MDIPLDCSSWHVQLLSFVHKYSGKADVVDTSHNIHVSEGTFVEVKSMLFNW